MSKLRIVCDNWSDYSLAPSLSLSRLVLPLHTLLQPPKRSRGVVCSVCEAGKGACLLFVIQQHRATNNSIDSVFFSCLSRLVDHFAQIHWPKSQVVVGPWRQLSHSGLQHTVYSYICFIYIYVYILIQSKLIYFFAFLFAQLYEINDDPKRKEFLDDLFSFMQKRGKYRQRGGRERGIAGVVGDGYSICI